MKKPVLTGNLASLVLSLFMLTACSISKPSKESDYYVLDSQAMPNLEQEASELNVVVVGPIVFADYLKRSSIAMREPSTQLNRAEFELWGGALEDEFHIALVKNLSAQAPQQIFSRYPTQIKTPQSYRVIVDVLQFDSSENGTATLEAIWGWLSPHGELLATGNFSKQNRADNNEQLRSQLLSELVQDFAKHLIETKPN